MNAKSLDHGANLTFSRSPGMIDLVVVNVLSRHVFDIIARLPKLYPSFLTRFIELTRVLLEPPVAASSMT